MGSAALLLAFWLVTAFGGLRLINPYTFRPRALLPKAAVAAAARRWAPINPGCALGVISNGNEGQEIVPQTVCVSTNSPSPPGIEDAGFFIREATYDDLFEVNSLLVTSFYDEPSKLYDHYHKNRELDRLQGNFPYEGSDHCMFVACGASDGKVVAFCDVDGRSTDRKYAPPRPYLSDLAVDPAWRRRGVARALISKCESKALEFGYPKLYLRVKVDNQDALAMYAKLGYDSEHHSYFGVHDDTLLLGRSLRPVGSQTVQPACQDG